MPITDLSFLHEEEQIPGGAGHWNRLESLSVSIAVGRLGTHVYLKRWPFHSEGILTEAIQVLFSAETSDSF